MEKKLEKKNTLNIKDMSTESPLETKERRFFPVVGI
jgi:hypothetical protein